MGIVMQQCVGSVQDVSQGIELKDVNEGCGRRVQNAGLMLSPAADSAASTSAACFA